MPSCLFAHNVRWYATSEKNICGDQICLLSVSDIRCQTLVRHVRCQRVKIHKQRARNWEDSCYCWDTLNTTCGPLAFSHPCVNIIFVSNFPNNWLIPARQTWALCMNTPQSHGSVYRSCASEGVNSPWTSQGQPAHCACQILVPRHSKTPTHSL